MELIILFVVVAIFFRVAYLGSTTISKTEFIQCIKRMDAPAVLQKQHAISWLLGTSRYHYVCVYKGHRLVLRTFNPIELPDTVDLIQIKRW